MELIPKFNELVEECGSYGDFHTRISKLSNNEKGVLQELFAKKYFMAFAKHYNIKRYCARILGDELPDGVNLRDLGSDAVIVHNDDTISLVQVKFRTDWKERLLRVCIGGMSLEALSLGDRFAHLFLFSNTLFSPDNLSESEMRIIKFVLADKLLTVDWSLITHYDDNRDTEIVARPQPPLRDWQRSAYEFVYEGGSTDFGRRTVVAACGSGKSLFADTVINRRDTCDGVSFYTYSRAIVVVPNLHLLSQWFEVMALWHPDRNYVLVGSDLDDDGTRVPYTLTTNTDQIATRLEPEDVICICTYQSLQRIVDIEGICFDVVVCDEAHVTANNGFGGFALPTLVSFPAENILFITATPKVFKGMLREDFVSMDDEVVYGPQFIYSFRKAIEDRVISDYRIIIGAGTGEHDNTEFNAEFLRKSIEKEDLNSVLIFSSSHAQSKEIYLAFKEIFNGPHKLILMRSGASSREKSAVIQLLNTGKPVIIFNVRVFSIGSDLVPLQAVMLNGEKGSVIDLVQSVSRCLRLHSEKDHGTLLVPCLVTEDALEGQGTFMKLRTFLSALGSVDTAIREEVVARAMNREGGTRRIFTDMVIGSSEEGVGDVCEDFELKMYTSLGRSANFSPEIRFGLLREFCEKEGRIPKAKEVYREFKIGSFLNVLLSKKHYATTRDSWIQSLLSIESIRDSLQSRINALNDEEARAKRKISPASRFNALVKFCQENGRLPLQAETHNSIPVGVFLNMLLQGKHYATTMDSWMQTLLSIDSIRDSLQSRMDARNDEDARAKRKISPTSRYNALMEFCQANERLPLFAETHNSIHVGKVLDLLLHLKFYATTFY
jgi:superfamily II DNA or RNA helicase